MTLLRTYLVMATLRGVAAVLAVLVAVTCAIDFVAQLNDVGTGDYGLPQAVIYVCLRVPRTIFNTLPIAALIGALLSLGNLAVHRELIVMRASGVSSWQLLSAVGLAGFVLAVLMVLLGESLAPSLGAYASEMRTRAMHEEIAVANGQSTWLREGDRIVSLRRHAGDLGYGGGVLLFELGAAQSLNEIARADSADLDASNRWVLSNYSQTSFEESGVTLRTEERESSEEHGLNPELLELSVVREDLLDTPSLVRYIDYLRANDLDAHRYLVAYWSRLSNVASVIVMTMLALPFVFGSLRSAAAGSRLVVGLIVGLTYYVGSEVLTSGGEVYRLDPLIIAWGPTALLFVVTAVAFARVR